MKMKDRKANMDKDQIVRHEARKAIKSYCNFIGYSDVEPYEVTKKITDRKVMIRRMKATKDETQKMEFIPGGFSAHCVNNHSQEWIIESDPTAEEAPVRWSEAKGIWQSKGGSKFAMSDAPHKFYDYNF